MPEVGASQGQFAELEFITDLQNGADVPAADDRSSDLSIFAADLSRADWRAECHEGRQKFPSGVAYLAHLLGHDTAFSIPKGIAFNQDGNDYPRGQAVNLHFNPLLLNTIYGRAMDDKLVMSRYGRFHLDDQIEGNNATGYSIPVRMPKFVYGLETDKTTPPLHAILADTRNAAHPILLQMSAEFMRYHNLQMDVAETLGIGGSADRFVFARAATVRCWHNIIRNDIVQTVTIDPTDDAVTAALERFASLRAPGVSANLAHAVFRCFHSLVNSEYHFNSLDQVVAGQVGPALKTSDMLKRNIPRLPDQDVQNFAIARENWVRQWAVDWRMFFDDGQENTARSHTCFSPSYAFKVNFDDIGLLDFRRQETAGICQLSDLPIDPGVIPNLLNSLKQFGSKTDWIAKGFAAHVPIVAALLAEGWQDVNSGLLGPLASGMFRTAIDKHLAAAEIAVSQALTSAGIASSLLPPQPQSFLEMSNST